MNRTMTIYFTKENIEYLKKVSQTENKAISKIINDLIKESRELHVYPKEYYNKYKLISNLNHELYEEYKRLLKQNSIT